MSAGKGFRPFRVVAKLPESSIITSFHLEPVQAEDWQPFAPGQFLVFRLPALDGAILRNYSISGPAETGRYRISVKREPAAAGFAAGLGSGFLHDQVKVGDLVEAQGPRGDFVLDRTSDRPVVLISGGVGLTPMVAMLHDLAQAGRRVVFLHGCENGDVHALRDEVIGLAANNPLLTAHFCYRNPSADDRANARFHSEGVITRALLQSLLCLDDYEVYLCGPPPFMQALYPMLRGLGVAEARIAYEFFGPATVLKDTPAPKPVAEPAAQADGAIIVRFAATGKEALWDARADSLLSFAEDQGLTPDFSCRAGICGTCVTRILSGSVEYFEEPLDELAEGEVLLCCSKPVGPIVLDL
jgi:uncharacterized protein